MMEGYELKKEETIPLDWGREGGVPSWMRDFVASDMAMDEDLTYDFDNVTVSDYLRMRKKWFGRTQEPSFGEKLADDMQWLVTKAPGEMIDFLRQVVGDYVGRDLMPVEEKPQLYEVKD